MIKLAKTAGFCFGVKRAVDLTCDLAKKGEKVYTLGQLIHNNQVTKMLEDSGVTVIDNVAQGKDGVVVIRTHGVTKKVNDLLDCENINYVDATCPFVKKIHNIVEKHYNDGYKIIIVGDKNHPEVIGIDGWCNHTAIIINSIDELCHIDVNYKYCLVSQTTFDNEKFKQIKQFINDNYKNIFIFDTICDATQKRQYEADIISKQVDMMVVIGGKHSSNTVKLFDICRKNCANTYHIETASELRKVVSNRCTIGITAGASSPQWIIKEVIFKMSEEKNVNEMSFAEALEQSFVTLKTGDVVKGIVIGVSPTEVTVDLGTKQDGIIKASEMSDDPEANVADMVKIGDEIEAFVIRVSDVEGVIGLSRKKLDAIAGRKKIEGALESKEILEGKVVEAVNGGIIVLSNGCRVFVPGTQSSDGYIADLATLVGKDVSFRIIDLNPKRRKVIGSIKSVAQEARIAAEAKFWDDATVGKEYKGVVKSLMPFGAFVDIGGIDGLVHISELSWGRIKHPSEILNVGDEVIVNIIALDPEKKKISLGYKKAEDNPWSVVADKIKKDDVIKVKIVRLAPFGAFAEIIPFVDGLIHISQISTERITKPSVVLNVGDEVDVKVIEVDLENKKISLSMRALVEDVAPAEEILDDNENETVYVADGNNVDSDVGSDLTEDEVNTSDADTTTED